MIAIDEFKLEKVFVEKINKFMLLYFEKIKEANDLESFTNLIDAEDNKYLEKINKGELKEEEVPADILAKLKNFVLKSNEFAQNFSQGKYNTELFKKEEVMELFSFTEDDVLNCTK